MVAFWGQGKIPLKCHFLKFPCVHLYQMSLFYGKFDAVRIVIKNIRCINIMWFEVNTHLKPCICLMKFGFLILFNCIVLFWRFTFDPSLLHLSKLPLLQVLLSDCGCSLHIRHNCFKFLDESRAPCDYDFAWHILC